MWWRKRQEHPTSKPSPPSELRRSAAEYRQWIDLHQHAVYRYCLWLSDYRPERAEDLCQETFLRAMTSFDLPEEKLRGWLRGTARRCHLECWRRESHAISMPPDSTLLEPEPVELAAPVPSAEDERRLESCRGQLAALERRILELRHPPDGGPMWSPPAYSWRQIADVIWNEGLTAPSGGRGRPRASRLPSEDEVSRRAVRAVETLRKCVHADDNTLPAEGATHDT